MKLFWCFLIATLLGCGKHSIQPKAIKFEGSEKVNLTGCTDDLMEPFLSRDGTALLFNNSNDPSVNTNLHWTTRVDEVTFEYKGELAGVNTTSLDAVPTMDKNGLLYFVSLRNYVQTLSSIYVSGFLNGTVSGVAPVEGISKNQVNWVNFDLEVTASGENLYFVDGRFDTAGGPYEADLVIAGKSGSGFQRLSNSEEILKNINTAALEYAACLSPNELELYFTRVDAPLSSTSMPTIFVSSRNSKNDPFGPPSRIESITGFAEAATISPDGNTLYYHKKDNGKFSLYLTRRVQ